jgi:hypothetical protein
VFVTAFGRKNLILLRAIFPVFLFVAIFGNKAVQITTSVSGRRGLTSRFFEGVWGSDLSCVEAFVIFAAKFN